VRAVAAAALLAVLSAVYAGEVLETEVLHDAGKYTVRFDVRLAAPPDRLKRYLIDYDNYATYFASVKESRVLTRTPDGMLRVKLQLHSCVLFFCRTVNLVRDITEQADGTITARIDPAQSDFRETTEQWRITAENGSTRLQYRAELIPAFYVPPLIGPWLVKGQIRSALESGAEKLEALAHE
jgi:hypothetical protein